MCYRHKYVSQLENMPVLENWVTTIKLVQAYLEKCFTVSKIEQKNGPQKNLLELEKCVTVKKLGVSQKDVSQLTNESQLENVSQLKNGSQLARYVTIRKLC